MLCGVASVLLAGQQWLAENPETALGLAIIAGSVVASGGAAIPAILLGAAAGGLFGYGAQVVFNLADPTISGLDIFSHFSWGVIAQSAFHGAVSGAVGGVLSPMLNAVGTRGLTKVALLAAGEFVSGRAQQVAVNVATPGRDWREDLFDPGRLSWWFDVGLDVIPGVTAAGKKGAWRGARSLRYADDVSLRQFDEGLDARRTFAASCANSFVAGTLVQTEDGLVPIEDIDVGDRVLSEDPETGERGFFEVVAVTNHPTDEVLAVTMEAVGEEGEGEAQSSHSTTHDVMQVTPEHPLYVEGRDWLLAENLELGDRLRRADGGMAKVLAIEQIRLDAPQAVYNFTVKGPHTYFVLDVGVLVHNASCPQWVDDILNERDIARPKGEELSFNKLAELRNRLTRHPEIGIRDTDVIALLQVNDQWYLGLNTRLDRRVAAAFGREPIDSRLLGGKVIGYNSHAETVAINEYWVKQGRNPQAAKGVMFVDHEPCLGCIFPPAVTPYPGSINQASYFANLSELHVSVPRPLVPRFPTDLLEIIPIDPRKD